MCIFIECEARNFIFSKTFADSGLLTSFVLTSPIVSVNGNVERRKTEFYYSIEFFLPDIAESNVISANKTKSVIVVFDVKRFSHTLWQLIYETKQTFVFAAHRLQLRAFVKRESQGFVFVLFYLYVYNVALLSLDIQNKRILRA